MAQMTPNLNVGMLLRRNSRENEQDHFVFSSIFSDKKIADQRRIRRTQDLSTTRIANLDKKI